MIEKLTSVIIIIGTSAIINYILYLTNKSVNISQQTNYDKDIHTEH